MRLFLGVLLKGEFIDACLVEAGHQLVDTAADFVHATDQLAKSPTEIEGICGHVRPEIENFGQKISSYARVSAFFGSAHLRLGL